ncbi:hypothetical protein Y1Q_0002132 [Alligator mississippiensis]|uniref:Uncharacterized protein n=1 Tax=Alligator mississippiensis TaxID=8496 RepID=A0A151MPN5_ALLMI|nr:hypothetical protein Y1Q_0002132 [Alligator mississippiensis]
MSTAFKFDLLWRFSRFGRVRKLMHQYNLKMILNWAVWNTNQHRNTERWTYYRYHYSNSTQQGESLAPRISSFQ